VLQTTAGFLIFMLVFGCDCRKPPDSCACARQNLENSTFRCWSFFSVILFSTCILVFHIAHTDCFFFLWLFCLCVILALLFFSRFFYVYTSDVQIYIMCMLRPNLDQDINQAVLILIIHFGWGLIHPIVNHIPIWIFFCILCDPMPESIVRLSQTGFCFCCDVIASIIWCHT